MYSENSENSPFYRTPENPINPGLPKERGTEIYSITQSWKLWYWENYRVGIKVLQFPESFCIPSAQLRRASSLFLSQVSRRGRVLSVQSVSGSIQESPFRGLLPGFLWGVFVCLCLIVQRYSKSPRTGSICPTNTHLADWTIVPKGRQTGETSQTSTAGGYFPGLLETN